jgi:methylmalonyl-CoA carboxyltransferase large subunit
MSKAALERLAAAVEQLQTQLAALTERIAKLEGEEPIPAPAAAAPVAAEPPPAPAPEPVQDEIPAEILLAISAAVAAYFGERPHIRAVRLVSTTRWSQEGRVSIQASHRLSRG